MSLSDLVQRKPSTSWSQPAKDEATGLAVSWQTCLCGCGEQVQVTRSPRLCSDSIAECSKSKREKQARELLRSRSEAIRQQVEQRLSATAAERGARVDVQIQRLIDAERPRIAQELLWEARQCFQADETEAELARIIEELKAKGAS